MVVKFLNGIVYFIFHLLYINRWTNLIIVSSFEFVNSSDQQRVSHLVLSLNLSSTILIVSEMFLTMSFVILHRLLASTWDTSHQLNKLKSHLIILCSDMIMICNMRAGVNNTKKFGLQVSTNNGMSLAITRCRHMSVHYRRSQQGFNNSLCCS